MSYSFDITFLLIDVLDPKGFSLTKKNRNKSPWPTKAVMSQIYEKHLWGGENYDFYSGEGSHHCEFVEPYIEVVKEFLESFDDPIVVCDLGCGDFNVGKDLFSSSKKYIGIDIVPELIERNKKKFTADNLNFFCLNIAEDELPEADCVILRQVLQHLSNKEVKQIADKLSNYKFVILTEHIPEGDFVPNKDIITGQGNRIKKNSGVDLTKSPFNLKWIDERELLRIKTEAWEGMIITKLLSSSSKMG